MFSRFALFVFFTCSLMASSLLYAVDSTTIQAPATVAQKYQATVPEYSTTDCKIKLLGSAGVNADASTESERYAAQFTQTTPASSYGCDAGYVAVAVMTGLQNDSVIQVEDYAKGDMKRVIRSINTYVRVTCCKVIYNWVPSTTADK